MVHCMARLQLNFAMSQDLALAIGTQGEGRHMGLLAFGNDMCSTWFKSKVILDHLCPQKNPGLRCLGRNPEKNQLLCVTY